MPSVLFWKVFPCNDGFQEQCSIAACLEVRCKCYSPHILLDMDTVSTQTPPNNPPDIAWQIRTLSESAKTLALRGQSEEAAKLYQKILEVAPHHVAALNFLAKRAMEQGDAHRSLELLERSVHANPERAMPYQNIGLVYKTIGEYDLALSALDRALAIKPLYPMALLHKGSVLELLGRHREAIHAYLRAWTQATDFQELRHSQQTLPHIRDLISHSADVIIRAKIAMLDRALSTLRTQHDATELDRVEHFVGAYLGTMPPRYEHAMQRPAFLHFPDLQPQAFFERTDFDWIEELEAATPQIRTELLAVLRQPEELQPYVQINAPDTAQWKELNYSLHWSSFHLYKAGTRIEPHCEQCPITASIVEKLPLARTPGQSPEVFFSILKPGTKIPPHFGLANYKLAVHLPLIVPEKCAIRAGNETRTWTEGQCLIFDDSFRHEAWNNSGEMRAVLIMDAWNPRLSAAERQAVAAVLGVIRDFDQEYGPDFLPGST